MRSLRQAVARAGTSEARKELKVLGERLDAEAKRLGRDMGPLAHDAVLVGDIASAAVAVLKVLDMLGGV
jgi:hypothetical protein